MTIKYMNTFNSSESRKRCLGYRRRILDISQQVSALHIGGAFSALEITDCIYHGFMRQNDLGVYTDVFLMSKGHGCICQYVILEELGYLSWDDLDSYCRAGGRLGVHPDRGVPGIEASTGSLGHGLGLAVGIAYAEAQLKKTDAVVYVLLSDGELQEGSTWEALMMAANLGLNNIVAVVDHNGFQSAGRTSESHPAFYPLDDKFRSFGWEVSESNGHDVDSLYRSVMTREKIKPLLVIANTVKGRGVSFMEDQPIWHYRSPSPEEYIAAVDNLREIGA
jgi:transketolase